MLGKVEDSTTWEEGVHPATVIPAKRGSAPLLTARMVSKLLSFEFEFQAAMTSRPPGSSHLAWLGRD